MFYRFLPIFRTFLGDFNPQKLPSRRLRTLWDWKNRVLLEECHVFNVAIPLRGRMRAELKVFKSSDCEWRKCRSTNSQRSRSNDDDRSDDATEYYDSVAGTQDVQAHAALSQNANGSVTNDCNHDHDNGGLVDHTCSSQRRCHAEPSGSEHREAARRRDSAFVGNRYPTYKLSFTERGNLATYICVSNICSTFATA